MLRRLYRLTRASLLHSLIPESKALPFENGRDGIEIVGLFHNPSGLGESARLCARQLQKDGYKIRCTSVEKCFFKKREIDWSFENTAQEDEIGLRIIHLNPPMMPPYAFLKGIARYASTYNAGYWAWELEHLPPEWIKALSYINAVMGPSAFTVETFRRYSDKPVLKVPHPVEVDSPANGIRKRLGIAEDCFLVSCVFATQSSLERKNPESLIRAFLQAFGADNKACLVFKISNIGPDKDRLVRMTRGHDNIRFIDDVWPREDILGLIKESNVYASLHRSEGFGLSLAEAMLLGTPVIATSWSGNVDFCNADNSFPVGYSKTAVRSTHSEFLKAGTSVWAEPDIVQAARLLRQIRQNPAEAQAKAARALETATAYFREPHYRKAVEYLRSLNPSAH